MTSSFTAVVGFLAYSGTFYPTGRQFYEACWAKQSKKQEAGKAPQATDPYTAVLWENCQTIALRGIYAEGMIFAYDIIAEKPGDEELAKACPSGLHDASEGSDVLVVREIQKSGGPTILDNVMPAEWTVGQVMKMRWPACNAERVKQGYPKYVEIKLGTWDWIEPCKRCEAEKKRKEEYEAHVKDLWFKVPVSQVELRDAKLEKKRLFDWDSSGFVFATASIRNLSKQQLGAFEIDITVMDCGRDKCGVVGRDTMVFYGAVPPQQVRTISTPLRLDAFGSDVLSKIRGRLSLDFRVQRTCVTEEPEPDDPEFPFPSRDCWDGWR